MKKVLCGIVCVAAGAALAVDPVTVSTVEVRAVNSGLTNTIVAIPGLDLAGGPLAISNLVKTTNLAVGDMLYAFSGGEYETWELKESADVKYWEKASYTCTISAEGISRATGTSAASYTMSVGQGIWLSRTASGTSEPFYVYAQQPTSTSTTVAAKETALVGNPTQSNRIPTITTPEEGDQVVVPKSKVPTIYTYNGSSWTVKSGWSGETPVSLPSITAGTGFWYVSNSNSVNGVTISWPAE